MGEFLIYEQETGTILRHDKTMSVQTNAAGKIVGEMTKQIPKVGSTTNDMNAVHYSNISQLVLVPLEPKDLKADIENWDKEELKAVVKALVKVINLRFPAGQKITAAELKAAIKAEL
jgi:hypothetical protein